MKFGNGAAATEQKKKDCVFHNGVSTWPRTTNQPFNQTENRNLSIGQAREQLNKPTNHPANKHSIQKNHAQE